MNFPAAATSDQLQNFDRALAVGGHDHWGILSPSHRRHELSIHAKTTTKIWIKLVGSIVSCPQWCRLDKKGYLDIPCTGRVRRASRAGTVMV